MAADPRSSRKHVVKPSPIHGTGLFAAAPIRRGDVVVRWEDTRELTPDEFARLSPDERHYVDVQDGKILLVGKPERYVNHSCSANTVPGELCDIAARDIAPGEEITADYSHFFIPSGSFRCACASAACRGLVKGRTGGAAQ